VLNKTRINNNALLQSKHNHVFREVKICSRFIKLSASPWLATAIGQLQPVAALLNAVGYSVYL
jgi:hypothetical protein